MSTLQVAPPRAPLALDEVARRVPAWRQSVLSSFDDCALSAYFNLAHGQGWSTHPQARGALMHRVIAECLRTMLKHGEETIPVSEALEILYEVLRQDRMWDSMIGDYVPVPVEEIVRVPLRQLRELRAFTAKWASDNSFAIHDIPGADAIEKRLSAVAIYPHPQTGEVMERTLTGQLDLLMFKPPAGALVVDWKDTWGLPPDHGEKVEEGSEDDGSGLSWHGYFQQRFYAWLVMKNFPKVQAVTLREFYLRHTEPRPATVPRERLHVIEQEMGLLAHDLDLAYAQGPPPWPYKLRPQVREDAPEMFRDRDPQDVPEEFVWPDVGRWKPSPGRHCGFCLKPGVCPIDDEAKGEGAISSKSMAERYAAEYMVAKTALEHRRKALWAWCDAHGPVPAKWAKGRIVAMWKRNKTGGGRRFGIFKVEESDRGRKQADAIDRKLIEAARESAARARAARPKRARR